ncbi:GNAT family N-acetyltransferase [Mucilaginibacter sp. L196]|uniref:GNAT family N-acetyltransferase n=1 Tax=Mucilaginibacter sp. L196 TaxID=1641870 RepID=UPI00131CCE70|nr:GNAT family N-acetyltransferase [Mucilaginibacter sp. L196]
MEFITLVKSFEELSPTELYKILRLRNEVFVVEQSCPYQDADNKDPKCYHLMLLKDDGLMAYARLVPPGLSFPQMSIGRVITSPKARGTGAGRILMNTAIEQCHQFFGEGPIQIGAQAYLLKFYSSLGFKEVGEIYDEDGIPHIDMIRA